MDGDANSGNLSIRYIRMKPLTSAMPIQACGELSSCSWSWSWSWSVSSSDELSLRRCKFSRSTGAVVKSSTDDSEGGKPGEACSGWSGLPSRVRISFGITDGMTECCQFTAVAERVLSSFWRLTEFALYRVSTPSGIITIKDVPTKTPIPIDEMSRSCDGDRVKASGSEPTTKDLHTKERCCQLVDQTVAV